MTLQVNEPSAKNLTNAGYKRTDGGVIPDSWDVKPLRDISSISSGGTPSRTRADYWNGDIPWITTSEVDFSRIEFAEQFISNEGLQNSAAKLLPPGTLLLALYGQGKTRGKVGVLGIAAATNQACAAIEIKRDVSPDFLLHFLTSRYDAIRGMSNGGSQDNLNSGIVKSILVPVPSSAEQRAIAAALSDVDALIIGLEKLIAKKRDLKQAAMQQLLTGQTRLPGFSGEWLKRSLIEVADIAAGLNKSTDEMGFGSLYVTVQDLYSGTSIDVSLLGRINASPAEVATNALEPGDIVFGKSSVKREGIGYPSQFFGATEPALFSGFCYRARAKVGKANPIFLFYALRSNPTRRWVIDNSQASALTNINKVIVDRIPLALPPSVEEQTAITNVLSGMDTNLTALESRIAKTHELKQGMMQELLTGRTRLV